MKLHSSPFSSNARKVRVAAAVLGIPLDLVASTSLRGRSESPSSWRSTFGLQPHRQETFKLSSDPLFVEKVRDMVGLYLDPPIKAMVLCVDEKSQIQALAAPLPRWP